MPVSARVAWTYLVSLLSLVISGIAVAISNQSLALFLCRDAASDTAGDCQLGWAIWVGLAAFLIVFIPVARRARLDWLLIALLWSGVAWLLAIDSMEQWWWWVLAVLMPAIVALASADWDRGPGVRAWQRGGTIAAAVSAVAAIVWWFVSG